MLMHMINILFTRCIFIQLLIVLTSGNIDDVEYGQIMNIEAVQGGNVLLPCNISSTILKDKITLVIWYKNNSESPIYSFDSRNTQLDNGSHWVNETVFGKRTRFEVKLNPGLFNISNVKNTDAGLYRCRVDFQRSPTRNSKVNVSVIIPPEQISILDYHGTHIKHFVLGPYDEGSTLNLTCQSTGGRPQPKLTWWHENILIDDSYTAISDKKVQNFLSFENLSRHHLRKPIICQASNNNITTPIRSEVMLNMNLKPLWVKIQGENRPLSAGTHYELVCEVVGAIPTPVITWWMGSILMNNSTDMELDDNNTTMSTLRFSPTIDDGGKYLSCRGEQKVIPNSGMENGRTLVIHHIPVVSLELGTNVNVSSIREGADVYFECNIKSTPWVYKVNWKHNGKFLYNNGIAGIIVSNLTLVLQNVTRARSGFYTCIGSNKEGDAESNAVQLDIRYAPLCRPGLVQIYNVARHETAKIICELEANPSDINFTWKFNTTISETVDLPANLIAIDKSKSIAHYTPVVEQDYGTLLCWGSNDIGTQSEPCIFNIIPAGRPDPLSNCTISNQTVNVLQLECIEGFDGGLPQTFEVQVFYARTKNLVTNQSSNVPFFALKGLRSDYGYDIVLTAKNAKGKSSETLLHMYTLNGAEKHTDEFPLLDFLTLYTGNTLQMKLILGVLAGLIVGVLLILIASMLVIRVRKKMNKKPQLQQQQQIVDLSNTTISTTTNNNNNNNTEVSIAGGSQQNENQTVKSSIASGGRSGGGCSVGTLGTLTISTDSLEKNPDIIPHGKEDNQCDDDGNLYQWPQQRTYVTAALATQCGASNSILGTGGGGGGISMAGVNVNNTIIGSGGGGGNFCINKMATLQHPMHQLQHHHQQQQIHHTTPNYILNSPYSIANDINTLMLVNSQQQQSHKHSHNMYQNQPIKFNNNQIQYTTFNTSQHQQHLQQLQNHQQPHPQPPQQYHHQHQPVIKNTLHKRENTIDNNEEVEDDVDHHNDDDDDDEDDDDDQDANVNDNHDVDHDDTRKKDDNKPDNPINDEQRHHNQMYKQHPPHLQHLQHHQFNQSYDNNQKKHKELTYAELSLVIPKPQKAIYTSATLGRPRNKDARLNEPTIYAQFDLAHQQRQVIPINGYPTNMSWVPTSQISRCYEDRLPSVSRTTPIVSTKETHSTTLHGFNEQKVNRQPSYSTLQQKPSTSITSPPPPPPPSIQSKMNSQQLPQQLSSSSSISSTNPINNSIRF